MNGPRAHVVRPRGNARASRAKPRPEGRRLRARAAADATTQRIGHDIAEGFATLPLMLSSVKIDDGRQLDAQEARRVVDAVRSSDGPRRALDEARKHSNAARDQLKTISAREATAALEALADYVVSRKL